MKYRFQSNRMKPVHHQHHHHSQRGCGQGERERERVSETRRTCEKERERPRVEATVERSAAQTDRYRMSGKCFLLKSKWREGALTRARAEKKEEEKEERFRNLARPAPGKAIVHTHMQSLKLVLHCHYGGSGVVVEWQALHSRFACAPAG